MRKSKKKLFEFLEELAESDVDFSSLKGIGAKGLKHPKVSNETYGRDSRIYITADTKPARYKLERVLIKNGFEVEREYFPGSSIVDVGVSYFKGWHWDE